MSDNQKWSILQGDALKVLGTFAPNTFDAVITDPPYASGGRSQAEKNKSTARKYSSMGENAPPPFDGDAKDQRSWTRWAAEWLYEARKVCRSGAPVCMFIDWRQLPAATDALQWAGWIWRGTAVWDKGNSRPQKGRFRQQAEYIVWGSNGDMPISRPVPCLPGVFKYGNPQSRIHLTEKPLQLMRDIVKITEPGGHILDPFAGSGTTVLAAVLDETVFRQAYDVLSASTYDPSTFSATKLSGSISCNRDGLLYTSVPQNGNWQVSVDGSPAAVTLVGSAMIAIPLSAGEHAVTFTYHNAAFALGWKISLACFVLFGVMLYLYRKPQKATGRYEARKK